MARALLDWDQKDLAAHTGLSIQLISDIEVGRARGSAKSLQRIEQAFLAAGAEFITNEGVRRKAGNFVVFSGRQGFIDFIWDVYETVKEQGGEVCISNFEEAKFDDWLGDEVAPYAEKIAKLDNHTFKVWLQEGDTNFAASEYAQYRWLKKEQFSSVPFYVYGDKYAMILFETDVTVYVLQNEKIANAQRQQFNVAWEVSILPGI